jgi:hypothetical protein
MTIHNSQTPLLSLLSPLFQGPYYNRRRSLPARLKPSINKLPGVSTWVCRYRYPIVGWQISVHGFGSTPTEAYHAWQREMDKC